MKVILTATIFLCFTFSNTLVAETTVLYQDGVVTVDVVLADPNDLWVRPVDLTRINGFQLKPEGACLDDICVPVKQDADSDLFVTRSDQEWFNVSELSRKLQQEYVHDPESSVWSFGPLPVSRNRLVKEHLAPDFTLKDRQGNPITLSAFKNKQVLLITWASW